MFKQAITVCLMLLVASNALASSRVLTFGGRVLRQQQPGSSIYAVLTVPGPSAPLWTPAELTTAAWYDASDTSVGNMTQSGGKVSLLADKSGNGRSLVQSTPANQMSVGTRTINGLPTLEGFNTVTHMDIANGGIPIGVSSDFSIFWVEKADIWNEGMFNRSVGNVYRYGYSGNALLRYRFPSEINNMLVPNSISLGDPVQTVIGRHSLQTFASNQGALTDELGTLRGDATTIGTLFSGYQAERFDGAFGEMIVYFGIIPAADRRKIEGYLAWKWGLAGNLPAGHPYKFEPPRQD